MKKVGFILLVILTFSMSFGLLCGCEKELLPIDFIRADASDDGYATIIVPDGQELNTLVLTDPQAAKIESYASMGNTADKTYEFMEALILAKKPDFVFITGDICINLLLTGFDLYKRYAEIFERLGVYWAFSLGNHDAENAYKSSTSTPESNFGQLTKTNLIKELIKYPHCLASVGDCTDIYETAGNYFINVRNGDGDLIKSFVSLDCCYGETKYSMVITESQIKWFKDNVNKLSDEEYGEKRGDQTIKTVVFTHVAVPELFIAANSIDNNQNNPDVTHLYGVRIEGDYSKYASDVDFFNSVLPLNSLEGMFFGHHHDNDLNVLYKGVRLGFVQSSTFCSYYRVEYPNDDPIANIMKNPSYTIVDFTDIIEYGDTRGGTEIIITANGEFTANPVYGKDVIPDYAQKFFSAETYIASCTEKGYTVIS